MAEAPDPLNPTPHVGTWARDTRLGRIGRVMDHQGGRVLLRPPGGGREWEAFPAEVEPLPPAETLSAKLADANDARRWEAR